MPDALESALLITLRNAIRWESALETVTASGTLTPVVPVEQFDATQYQRRDRELAFRDTINAAAIVEVAVEVADVWGYQTERPRMQGPQRNALPWNPQDARNVNSQVLHVKNVHVPYDAVQFADRDLYGRDALIYETLARACAATFAAPPISVQTSGTTTIPNVTAWSWASGTEVRADISTALPMSRDLFKLPDQNLADRDNQMAGYVARLVQVLKNPFAFAERLYVRISNTDEREIEVYSLIRNYFVSGTAYSPGNEVFFGTGYYRALSTTSEVPTNATFWLPISSPTQRIYAIEPRLSNRNRIIYDTDAKTLQWFHETGDIVHVPQLYAMSIPGIFAGQRVNTVAQVPERKDSQYWRQKAARVAFTGQSLTDLSTITNTASFAVTDSLIQPGGASFTIPGRATFKFNTGSLPPGQYRVALLCKPHSTVEIAGAQNNEGFGGTLGGATYVATGTKLSWNLGLPPTQWTFAADYTNLQGTTEGFKVIADLSGAIVLQDTVPLYFNDADGNPLPNGQIVTSTPVAVNPTGQSQVFGLKWTGGNGNFHVRTLRFETSGVPTGHYRMAGTLADSVSTVDVTGGNKQTDLLLFDFTTGTVAVPNCTVTFVADAQLPIRFLEAHLMSRGTYSAMPLAQGFEGFRNDCTERALRSVQDSFDRALTAYGTNVPEFRSTGNTWDGLATERWMSFIEVYEQRLRELPNIPSGQIVSGRQYKVSSGTVVYFGTHVANQLFYGTWTGSTGTSYATINGAGTVAQVGAFTRGRAGHVGQPALIPAGLEYNTAAGTVTGHFSGSLAVPQVAALQPWMAEAGAYAAQSDFWSPLNV